MDINATQNTFNKMTNCVVTVKRNRRAERMALSMPRKMVTRRVSAPNLIGNPKQQPALDTNHAQILRRNSVDTR